MNTYTTVQGDTFDQIAKAVYDNERRMDVLVESNPKHAGVAVFEANTVLSIPELPEDAAASDTMPSWRIQA